MAGLVEIFHQNVDKNPDKTAIICENESLNYSELEYLVNKFAGILIAGGVKYGDNIGVLLPNGVEFVALILASAAIGASVTPLSHTLPALAVNQAFVSSDVKHFVTTQIIAEDLEVKVSGFRLEIDENTFSNACAERVYDARVAGDEALIFTMTSGSTGSPKPIVLSQKNKLDRAFSAINLYDVTPDDVILAATPLYHSLAERLVLMPLLLGATSVLMPRFSPSAWLETVKKHRVTFSIAVSSQLKQIAETASVDGKSGVDSLRCLVSSSALLEPETKNKLIQQLHCDLHECYGTSEVAIATNLNFAESSAKIKTVGRAIEGVDVKILKDDNTFASRDEIGEIVCKTPMLFAGYYKLPKMTAAAMFGEYFKTGDLGKIDEDGYLYFVDRKKDIIISGGINIYPNDIEDAALKFDKVIECAAFPLPDKALGEVVAIAIVAKEGFDLRQFRFHCSETLADFQIPRKYFTVDNLPRNNMGKLTKHKLVELYAKE